MNSEELLTILKLIREKMDHHRSCSDSLLRRVIDIRRVLENHPEGNNNFALKLLYFFNCIDNFYSRSVSC